MQETQLKIKEKETNETADQGNTTVYISKAFIPDFKLSYENI